MTNQEYINELIKTIPVSEGEISTLGTVFDIKEKERDLEFQSCVRKVSKEAGRRLKGDQSGRNMEAMITDMLILFGTNHLRLRLINNIIESLREEIANGNP